MWPVPNSRGEYDRSVRSAPSGLPIPAGNRMRAASFDVSRMFASGSNEASHFGPAVLTTLLTSFRRVADPTAAGVSYWQRLPPHSRDVRPECRNRDIDPVCLQAFANALKAVSGVERSLNVRP